MNLAQAIQTGRPFRQKGDSTWMELSGGCFNFIGDDGQAYMEAPISEYWFMTDDWETKEVKFTEEEFWYAYGLALNELNTSDRQFIHHYRSMGELMARKLGIKLSTPE